MKGLIMFPVMVLLLATFVTVPTLWEGGGEVSDVSRNVTDEILTTVTNRVQYWQDEYGTDPVLAGEPGFGDYTEWMYNWTITYQYIVRDDLLTLLNNEFSVGITSGIISIHENMAEELSVQVAGLGDIAGDGRYITEDEVYDIIQIADYLYNKISYQQNLEFARDVTPEQTNEFYSLFAGLYNEYGNPGLLGNIQWYTSQEATVKVSLYNKLNNLFSPEDMDAEYGWDFVWKMGKFPLPIPMVIKTPSFTNVQHERMAVILTELIHDSETLPERETVFSIIRLDGDIWEQLELLEGRGFALDAQYIWIGILMGVLGLALVVGVKIFDSGLSDSTVHTVIIVSSYYLIWLLLSFGGMGLIRDIPVLGLIIWAGLTLMYTMGVMGNLSQESA